MKEKMLIFNDQNGKERYDYAHMVALIRFCDDDSYNLTEVIVNEIYKIKVNSSQKLVTQYRSQGNYQIIFSTEGGPYFYKGFDGHKGNIFIDSNIIMSELIDHINNSNLESKSFFDFELLGVIEMFFVNYTK